MGLKMVMLIFTLYSFVQFCTSSNLQKKHAVLIVADDLGWNDVSFHGSNEFLTPNIDALAYSGVILQNYYVLPTCSPSRSALMTGLHPIKTGLYHYVISPPQPTGLPLDIKILPQYLKDYGYKTHMVGKWHLGFCKADYTPTRRGFDSHFGYWTGHEDYYNHTDHFFGQNGNDFREGMDDVSSQYKGQYSTDLFTERAVNVIESHNVSDPLFLYMAHQAVHTSGTNPPLQAPQEVIDKFKYIENEQRRIFAAMAWKLDESVGMVVQALARKNILEDTVIIFTTDNGGPAGGFQQNMASNWPLKGVKDTLWEGGVRGAAFIWSANLPHLVVNNALMHIQDWLPTIIGAIDEQSAHTIPELQALDGRNMWPVLMGQKESEYDELLLQRDDLRHIAALRNKNWKLIRGVTYIGLYDKWFGPSGRDDIYKYNVTEVAVSFAAAALRTKFQFPTEDQVLSIRSNVTISCDYCGVNDTLCTPCNLRKEPCLFDVFNDPCERNNLANKYRDIVEDMSNRIEKYKPVRALYPPPMRKAIPLFWNNTWTNWMDYGTEDSLNVASTESSIRARILVTNANLKNLELNFFQFFENKSIDSL